MVTLKESHLKLILEHCRQKYPLEACGLLVGKGEEVGQVYPVDNIKSSSTEYLVDPEQQFRIFKKMREEGTDLIGIYHSHPRSSAYPSVKDREMAFYPEASYIIVSLQDFFNPQVKAFRIRKGKVEEEELKIIKD